MATYDWSLPTTTTNYSTFVTELHSRLDQVAKGFVSTDTHNNLVVGAISFRNNKWQTWSGSTWSDLTSTYAISISGSASNITSTLTVDKGGTNISSYTIGDLLYASSATALSKLAGVATGNVLLSGGIATAPSWGKIDLSTHTNSTMLPVTKGGLGTSAITGLVKGTGNTYEAAVAGTDYAAASHTHSYLPTSGGTVVGNLSTNGSISADTTITAGTGLTVTTGDLTVSSGSITASGNVTAYSDIRLKSNINTLEKALDKVLQLRGVSYTKAGKPEIGVIAQEVEKIIPEVVCNTGEYKAVAYGNLVALLIEAIKELDRKVDARTCN